MKTFLIALAFVGANAMACPGAKDASATSTDKSVAAVVKAKPAVTMRANTKTATKVAVKPSTDLRKAVTL